MSKDAVSVVRADLARTDHEQAIVELIDAYASESIGGGQPLSEFAKAELVPGLRAHPTTRVFLAFEGERAIGIAVCFLGFSSFAARRLLNIHDLAVKADWRKRGVGRALIEAAAEAARELDCCRLTLEVRGDNDPARRLYDGLGFRSDAGQTDTFFLSRPL
ncbi:MAG: GNAT family N-acetyltransferase [bacterium]|nr:GNAT family N-acetyltransferase [bacterium]